MAGMFIFLSDLDYVSTDYFGSSNIFHFDKNSQVYIIMWWF